ncbi:MAG: cupredoxin domain-containing protein [Candidatus Omnitrophica bacterium]|nr:cupredoxin domain-containing protein [Candidatus Omnitrophota bacterium]
MRRNEFLAIVFVLLATVGTIFSVFAIEKFRIKKFYTVELIARVPEHGNWYPRKIKVAQGKEVKLLIRNIDTVTHGFAIPDLQVSAGEIKAGEVKVVRFTPQKKGIFPFMCTVWCSDYHMEMRGELIVE